MSTHPSIYDYRDAEVENARRIRRERLRDLALAVVVAPFVLAALAVWVIVCAVL